MGKDKTEKREVSRRNFLVGAGLLIPTAVAVPTTIATTAGGSTVVKTVTRTAAGGTVQITAAAKPSFMTPPPVPAASKIINTVTADVVILGGGNSGFAAACRAAEKGASVAVIEQQTESTHHTWTKDLGVVNSRMFLDAGVPRIDEWEFINEYMRASANRMNIKLLKIYAFRSGEVADWLMDHLPDEIKAGAYTWAAPVSKLYQDTFGESGRIGGWKNFFGCIGIVSGTYVDGKPHPKFEKVNGVWNNRVWTWTDFDDDYHKEKRKGGFRLMIDYSKSLGAKWYYGMHGEQLIQDGTGRVTGMYAHDGDGNYTKFMGDKGVILAGGDFSNNPEMALYYGTEVKVAIDSGWKNRLSATGPNKLHAEGMAMALWVGGKMQYGLLGGLSSAAGSLSFGGPFPRFNYLGKRYCSEFKVYSKIGVQEKAGLYCQICDSKYVDYMALACTDHGGGVTTVDSSWEWAQEMMDAVPLDDPKGGYVVWTGGGALGPKYNTGRPGNTYKSNTIEGLADLIGYTGNAKRNFIAEVRHYNDMCYAGKGDLDWGKPKELMWAIDKPPFYCNKSSNADRGAGVTFCCGGIQVDGNFAVVDKNDDPIPGLFAAGNNVGARFPIDYISLTSGNAMGMAITHGYCCGEYVASLEA